MSNTNRAGVYIGVSRTATCREFFLSILVSWLSQSAFQMRRFG